MTTEAKMSITLFEILQLLIGTGLLGSAIWAIFRVGKFAQKFESLEQSVKTLVEVMHAGFAKIDARFDKNSEEMKTDFSKIDAEFKETRKEISDVKIHLGILETRVDERTLKIVHVEKTGTGILPN